MVSNNVQNHEKFPVHAYFSNVQCQAPELTGNSGCCLIGNLDF